MRKRRTRYSERNTRYHSRKGQTFQQIILSIVALFLVVIFLVVLCTDPMGNNGSVPPENVMAAKDADETADSNVSQSDESVSDTASADGLDQTSDGQTDSTASSSDWRLLLVNSTHSIADDYSIDLTELRNGQSVDSRILTDLQEMFDAARSEDIYPIVSDAYRTREEQQALMDDTIQNYEDEGYSAEEATSKAEQVIAKPGTSEHETGLAIDITGDEDYGQDTDSVLAWMNDNAYKYGFVLRYPSGKESVTGAAAEDDHYRYVGKEAAKVMYDKGICLEEYLSQNN